jgi:hypothetical protein
VHEYVLYDPKVVVGCAVSSAALIALYFLKKWRWAGITDMVASLQSHD